jgi:hypothetical protein
MQTDGQAGLVRDQGSINSLVHDEGKHQAYR